MARAPSPLAFAQPATRAWFEASFEAPTPAQAKAWPPIVEGRSTLLLAPTGSGKTLAAFLTAINRLMFSPEPDPKSRCRVLYISPLKALGVDVERNLRAPIAGIANMAERLGHDYRLPSVGVRTGDTPQNERARMLRHPPDILITTPESLYLLLTSNARETLQSIDSVIVDEIHSMVASKRGTHLFVSLERLEALRRKADGAPLQRIGLSATQRPLDEVARLLGGGAPTAHSWRPRAVEIVDAGTKKSLELRVEVPVEDMTQLGETDEIASGSASAGPAVNSIWPSMHPRLVELIRAHRSTMIFVNSRRLAERLATALNELAEDEIALAHHGSISKEKRLDIEDRLKRGDLPAIVATSSLELGIDMGAVDLVIQVEAPPSVASGLQRIGRGSHQVGATSRGILFPKFRGDLLASAAATAAMYEGKVEETFYPRNPLDVLAQQVVAMASVEPASVDEIYEIVRGAAPFADLPRTAFEGVLDMLSGRYPSDEFAELRPRITWDRVAGRVEARRGAKRIAVTNGGTIPDRGLYGVFLAGQEDGAKSRRVGELDEEMVFETQPGEVFLLGASSWRVEEITHDRVLVTPAPGQPGRMPFWHGDRPGRPAEFGREIGALTRKLGKASPEDATVWLESAHGLDARAAKNLVAYIQEQIEATEELPTDRHVVVERFVDEVGDWRVCVMTPFGARVHAPWGTAIAARLREQFGGEVDIVWSDDGMVFRIPEADEPPASDLFFPSPDEAKDLVIDHLFDTSLFAGRFRENAGRALLLPKRHPGRRTPLWAQRKRSADLLKVASKYRDFPIILETFRECLQDVFDLPALTEVLRDIRARKIRVHTVDAKRPSPFASSLLFDYVANFIYNGDAPIAERRAQILAIDHAQLRELLGEAELRELFDAELLTSLESRLQKLESKQAIRHPDHLHDILLALGDLDRAEIIARAEDEHAVDGWLSALLAARRVVEIRIAGTTRFIAAEDMARYRDAIGIAPPPGLPAAFLELVPDALSQLLARYARTHAPFTSKAAAERFGVGLAPAQAALESLTQAERLVAGEFIPGGRGPEWCSPEVLRSLKQLALAKLRREVEPVEARAFARFLPEWQSAIRPRRGLDAVLNAVEQLQGAAIPASVLEASVLPARVEGYRAHMLDELCAAGEIIWRGLDSLGPSDGRVALFLTDHYTRIAPAEGRAEGELALHLRELFADRGAMFMNDLVRATGAFPGDIAEALWDLVWAGELTNDTLAPMRSKLAAGGSSKDRRNASRRRAFTSRRLGPPGTEGRWSLLPSVRDCGLSSTERSTAKVTQLLERHGVLTREAVHAEGIEGGFSAVYPVLKAMEESGRVRRGYFVQGLGATQFALPGADDRLRQQRDGGSDTKAIILAATDPANPYGAALSWPSREGARPQRAAGASVVLLDGVLIAYLGRTERSLLTFVPEPEPDRSHAARALCSVLAETIEDEGRRAVLISTIDGEEPGRSFLAPFLEKEGFSASSRGFLKRRSTGA